MIVSIISVYITTSRLAYCLYLSLQFTVRFPKHSDALAIHRLCGSFAPHTMIRLKSIKQLCYFQIRSSKTFHHLAVVPVNLPDFPVLASRTRSGVQALDFSENPIQPGFSPALGSQTVYLHTPSDWERVFVFLGHLGGEGLDIGFKIFSEKKFD